MAKPKNQRIRIKLKAYDHRLIDQATQEIVDTISRTGAMLKGPIPLPTRIEKMTIRKSPHKYNYAVDQLEIRTHLRLLDIMQPDPVTVEALMKLNLASGVTVQISVDDLDALKAKAKA